MPDLPKRIVSLAPHATELLFDAGGGNRLAAVTGSSDFPEEANKLPNLGPYNSISLEAILIYRPDLVLAWPSGNSPEILKQLENLKIPVYNSEPRSVEAIAGDLRALSTLAGGDAGIKKAEGLLRRWHELANTYQERQTVPTFLEVWNNPLMTLNGDHMVSSVMKVCGAENIFADAPVLVLRVSREDVIARTPYLIVEGDHTDRVGTDVLYNEWKKYSMIPAVKNRDVYTIDGSLLLRPTPRIIKGTQLFCEYVEHARSFMPSP
ncbi:cobalamin-binding protein [Parendozoicomonas sp. Alg238-R29]|uniref:cobalamin-binding protein n=1 Tax=Parendozoicomonas sp. Alg238-R29 TaxID=2993446 RepID=UPI00248EA6A3|nr:cobalamin-binding protein [Parendozoicomonas sp. Alg238-R29]